MINKIKAFIKQNKHLLAVYNYFFYSPIINVNNRRYNKRVLVSYSVYPFKNKNKKLIHPNYIENYTINDVFDKLEYNVDIYNNIDNRKIDYSKYNIIIGEGLPISNYFTCDIKQKDLISIYYATGSHPIFGNNETIKVLFRFYKKYKQILYSSTRIVDNKWYIGSSLSDYIILIGNEVTKKSFLNFVDYKKIITINPPFYLENQAIDFKKKNKKRFLWFGSYGLLHKGLDIVLETFLERSEIELHVCGYLDGEENFMKIFNDRIQKNTNIFLHGFLDLKSQKFKELMNSCSFVVLTSVAEGCSTAVITTMGNGGLIPIITKETGIDLAYGIEVKENNVECLNSSIDEALKFSKNEIEIKSKENIKYIKNNFSELKFRENLNCIITEIITNE